MSPQEALKYAMHHGIKCEHHWLSADAAYEALVENWNSLEWKITQDTYQERESYRAQIQTQREQKKRSESEVSRGRGRSRSARRRGRNNWDEDDWGYGSSSGGYGSSSGGAGYGKGKKPKGYGKGYGKGGDTDLTSSEVDVIPQLAVAVAEHLGPMLAGGAAAAPARASLQDIGRQPAQSAQGALPDSAGVLDITSQLRSTDDQMAVPREALVRLQNNLQNAEHTLSRTVQEMIRSAKSLKMELEGLQQSIDILAQHTGQPAQHLQRIV